MDVFLGIVLPPSVGPVLGCPGGDAALFLTGTAVELRCLSARPATFPPLAAGVTVPGTLPPTTVENFLTSVIPGEAPAGTYTVFLALIPAGAFASDPIDPSRVLVAAAAFSIQP